MFRLKVLLGWYRVVCGNGLVLGRSSLRLELVHDQRLERFAPELGGQLLTALQGLAGDRRLLRRWHGTEVSPQAIARWVDGPVIKAWGVQAAARVHGICATGRDGHLGGRGKVERPSEHDFVPTIRVPAPALTAYDCSQALTWLATHRPLMASQVQWQEAVPSLMAALVRRAG